MRKIVFIITILSSTFLSAFTLKDKITNGQPGDYVVTEQGGTSSVLLIRELNSHYLILEEIDVPSLHRKKNPCSWKEWIQQEAPGHTAWISYVINLKTGQLEKCYSYAQEMWLATNDPYHFLPKLLSLSLQQTTQDQRKRIGPPPLPEEEDRRSIWTPPVTIEGQKQDKAITTAWKTKWPKDETLISECEIEVYFTSHAFPVWIEVRSPHYKASLRTLDSGHGMNSPKSLSYSH